jgi:hypothetical protein
MTTQAATGRMAPRIAAGVAVAFGILTVVSGGAVLFGGVPAGATVPLVLWFNFLSGVVYVVAGAGIALRRPWAAPLAVALAAAIGAVFALFGLHVLQGGAFEMRTALAMALRLAVWIAIAAVAVRAARPRGAAR